jgi:16S rRNA A1518/A1519 N6-dimethyltransferase RsmA/KsgA/DIM1 with predicted DNA glycosylase/AP lyase activity
MKLQRNIPKIIDKNIESVEKILKVLLHNSRRKLKTVLHKFLHIKSTNLPDKKIQHFTCAELFDITTTLITPLRG